MNSYFSWNISTILGGNQGKMGKVSFYMKDIHYKLLAAVIDYSQNQKNKNTY